MLRPLTFSLAALCGLFAVGCSNRTLPPTGGPALPPAAQQGADVISTFTLVGHNEAGRKKWEVQGETADLLSETVQLSPVEATSYGREEVHLTADRGWFDKGTQDVRLEGNVVAATSDGARLETSRLNWVQEKETGETNDWVNVTRGGMIAHGLGGVGMPHRKRVRLERQVTVTLQNPPVAGLPPPASGGSLWRAGADASVAGQAGEGATVITCDGPMEVDYGRHRARFWRNVVVRDAKGVTRSDRLDVAWNPTTQAMEKAIFWGHVEIRQGRQVATANRANYWQAQGRMQLLGHPRLVTFQTGEVE